VIFFLVFPLGGKTNARLGFDIVPPHVLSALAVSPDVFTGDAAGVTANALIQMENH
jgi:hypothetical protein